MKRHILFFTSITLVATILFSTMLFANAEANRRELYYNDDFIYEILPDNTITIHYYIGSATQVTVPSYIDRVPVVSIEPLAFYDTTVKNVRISEGIVTLKDESFFYTSRLESVTLPSTLKTVGQGVFRDCVKLKTVTFSKNTSALGNYMFYGCTRLEDVNLPDSITNIPIGMFSYCMNLKQIELPKDLNTIYDYAFYNCGLESIKLPKKLRNIHQKAFANNSNLAEIICADTEYAYVSKDAFDNCIAEFPGFEIEDTTTYLPEPTVASSVPAYTTEPATSSIATDPTEPTDISAITTVSPEPTVTSSVSTDPTESAVSSSAFTDPPEPSVNNTKPKPPSVDTIFPETTSGGNDICGTYTSEPSTAYTSTAPSATHSDPTESKLPSVLPTEDITTEPSAAYSDPTESKLPSLFPTEDTVVTSTASTPAASISTEPSKPEDYITGEGFYIGGTDGFLLYESSKISSAKDTVNNSREELLALAWNVRTLGDVNNDNEVNIKDATQIQCFTALLIDENSPDFNYKNADVNTDGKVTIRDATIIQKFVAKLIDSLY